MPLIPSHAGAVHEAHGSRFVSYVAPSRGSEQLTAWRLEVPAETRGMPHRPSREEVLLVLDGELHVTVDGVDHRLRAGDVALVPADGELTVGTGQHAASAWVTTTPGLMATLADGSQFSPPWAS